MEGCFGLPAIEIAMDPGSKVGCFEGRPYPTL